MMRTMKTCADLEPLVTPYVDEELVREERTAVEAHLALCPPCRARAAAERAARKIVRAHAGLLAERAPASLRARCCGLTAAPAEPIPVAATERPPLGRLDILRMRRLRSWAPLSLAATLVLGVGASFFYGMTNRLEAAFVAQLTTDHAKCFIEAELGASIDAGAAEAQVADLYGWDIRVPPASRAEEMELVDVRRCVSGNGYMAHLLYTRQGRPVSLFVVQGTAHREQLLEIMGHDAVVWSEAEQTYVLVGQEGPVEMNKVAAYVRRASQQGSDD